MNLCVKRRMLNLKKNKFLFILIMLSLLYGCVFGYLKYLQYRSFFSFEWDDEASQIQLAFNTFRGDFLHQTIFIAPFCYGRFTPFIIIMAVFYLFFPYPPTWFFVTGLSYGFSSVLLYLIGKRILRNEQLSFFISLSFLFYAPLHYANLGMAEAKSLALFPLIAVFYFLETKRLVPYLIFIIIAMSTKQDVALITLLIGLYCFWRKYPKEWGLITIILSVIYFFAANILMNTIFYTPGVDSHPEINIYAKYDLLTIRSIYIFLFTMPMQFLQHVFSFNHLRVLWLSGYPVLFIPLLSLETYIALPMLMELFLLKGFQNYNSEYIAVITPFVFIGLIYAFEKILRIKKIKVAFLFSFIISFLCIISNLFRNIIGDGPGETPIDQKYFMDKRFSGVTNFFDFRLYAVDAEDEITWRLISMIPRDSSVTATGDLLIALATRRKLFSFGLNDPEALESEYGPMDYYPAYESDYILIHTKNLWNGLGGQYAFVDKELANRIIEERLIPKHNYVIISREKDLILLKKNNY